ncbi:MAG: hypothetical protein WC379_17890 [Methanoregula sp.]|jgi:hypothetical protein
MESHKTRQTTGSIHFFYAQDGFAGSGKTGILQDGTGSFLKKYRAGNAIP